LIIRNSVDFPAPDLPMIPTKAPFVDLQRHAGDRNFRVESPRQRVNLQHRRTTPQSPAPGEQTRHVSRSGAAGDPNGVSMTCV